MAFYRCGASSGGVPLNADLDIVRHTHVKACEKKTSSTHTDYFVREGWDGEHQLPAYFYYCPYSGSEWSGNTYVGPDSDHTITTTTYICGYQKNEIVQLIDKYTHEVYWERQP